MVVPDPRDNSRAEGAGGVHASASEGELSKGRRTEHINILINLFPFFYTVFFYFFCLLIM